MLSRIRPRVERVFDTCGKAAGSTAWGQDLARVPALATQSTCRDHTGARTGGRRPDERIGSMQPTWVRWTVIVVVALLALSLALSFLPALAHA